MEKMKVVNRDYICVLRRQGNLVKFVQEPIEQSVALESILKTTLENPNMCVLDMQDQMMLAFREDNRPYISYLSPDSYASSYVEGVSFPKEITYEKYNEELQEREQARTVHYLNAYIHLKENEGEDAYQGKVKEYTDKDIEKFIKDKKETYYKKCIRYIDAYNYKTKLSLCEADGDNVMYSSESIGWNWYEYKVNDDVIIYVNTNFGYGYSSYFTLGLKYKGIDILPYSSVVNYYYADMRDILRYLRNYSTQSKSWNHAFDFVEKTANQAATEPDKFCEKFLKNEINSMLAGLADVIANPDAFLNKFATMTSVNNDSGFITVRAHMNVDEKSKFKVYPYEMAVAFMAEKIMNALMLLNNLESVSMVYSPVQDAVLKVKEISMKGLPKIKECADKMIPKLNSLREALNKIDAGLDRITSEIKKHEEVITSMVEERNRKGESVPFYIVEQEYKNTHKEYSNLCEEKRKLVDERSKVNEELRTRLNFLDVLNDCIDMVEKISDNKR